MDEPPRTGREQHDHDESKHRPGDGAQAWLGLLMVIVCAAGCALAVVFAVRRWGPL